MEGEETSKKVLVFGGAQHKVDPKLPLFYVVPKGVGKRKAPVPNFLKGK